MKTIQKNNLLRGVALDVYGIITRNPNLTVGEIFRKYKGKYPQTTRSRNELAKRVTDLESWGAIATTAAGRCPTSGRMAMKYAATGAYPKRTKRAKNDVRDLMVVVDKPTNDLVTSNDPKAIPNAIKDAVKTAQGLRQSEGQLALSLLVQSLQQSMPTYGPRLKALVEKLGKAKVFETKKGTKARRETHEAIDYAINTLEYALKNVKV